MTDSNNEPNFFVTRDGELLGHENLYNYRVKTETTWGKFIPLEDFERALRAHIHSKENTDTSKFIISPHAIYHDCNRSSIQFRVQK